MREDWTLFRTLEGLQQRAGVTVDDLPKLVLKELADNALDTGAYVAVGETENGRFVVRDAGPGIDGSAKDIAELFSIKRPMRSSKLLRLPTRGALGNGLRVVAGAVLASEGSLVVTTKNKRITLHPETDGTTTVVDYAKVDHPVGTTIEIGFGPALGDTDPLAWAREACRIGQRGEPYKGKSSPHWYDPVQFHELLLASGARPVRDLLANDFEGCSGQIATAIVEKAQLGRMPCDKVNRAQAKTLLLAARHFARPVKPLRRIPGHYYAVQRGIVAIGSSHPQGEIPFVVEAWAEKKAPGTRDRIDLQILVNRTPVTDDVTAYRENKTTLQIWGCGLSHDIESALQPKGAFDLHVNVTTPYYPKTSDGKAPDLEPFLDAIAAALRKAIGKAQRAAPKAAEKLSIKAVVLENLQDAIDKASGNSRFEFNLRQLYYILREPVMQATGSELKDENFSGIVTDYERDNGPIPGMYREPRGSLMHPHSKGQQIALGDRMVREYERPAWTFSSILYVEKEGFTQALIDAQWLERHDCALLSSKGFTTRAAKDLIDKLAEHDEPVTVFCVHDADASGTLIYETFQEETKARGARKVKIVNLGLEPSEAIKMGLAAEKLAPKDRNRPVADYVPKLWRGWLQTNRVELNAMTTPQLLDWLDDKMAEHGNGKLIPPVAVMVDAVDTRIRQRIRDAVLERLLREHDFEGQVAAAIAAIDGIPPTGPELIAGLEQLFDEEPERPWRDHIEVVAYQSAWSQLE